MAKASKAREIVVTMGLGYMNWTDAQWKAADFQTWNYSYNIGNPFREDLLILLQDNLDLIGIEVIDQPLAYFDFLHRIYGDMGVEEPAPGIAARDGRPGPDRRWSGLRVRFPDRLCHRGLDLSSRARHWPEDIATADRELHPRCACAETVLRSPVRLRASQGHDALPGTSFPLVRRRV